MSAFVNVHFYLLLQEWAAWKGKYWSLITSNDVLHNRNCTAVLHNLHNDTCWLCTVQIHPMWINTYFCNFETLRLTPSTKAPAGTFHFRFAVWSVKNKNTLLLLYFADIHHGIHYTIVMASCLKHAVHKATTNNRKFSTLHFEFNWCWKHI